MLPFVTPPAPVRLRRIGNARCGVLEIEERGGLSVEEDDAITTLLEGDESAFVEGAKAAELIEQAEEGVSIVEAFSVIKRAIAGEDLEPAADAIRLRHAELVHRVAQVFARTGQRTMDASVTALIQSRLNLPNWTLEQTRKMDRTLFRGLHRLVLDEQTAEAMPDQPATSEELGKPPADSGSKRRRTGRKSSGSSAPDSPDSSSAPPSDES